jgi:bifunctional non-homologous end joining protein LigD
VETLKTDRAPLATDRKIKEGSWVRPGLRLEVKSLRGEEMLRHATVERIVARPARPKPARKAAGRSEPAQIIRDLPPRDAIADYYRRLAPAILRWASNRPLNLFRCEGAYCFFQRNRSHPQTSARFEAPIRHVRVAQKNGKTETYLYIEDEPGVMACVDAQSIEFHGWGSCVADIERPDRIAIDLDPDEGIGFAPVKAAAFEVRDHLKALGLESFPLLSGGKGVHVVIPLTPHAEWAAVREFTLRFCEALAEAAPERFTVALPKEQRRGRIFLDYLRNQRTATAIMPYSVRARPGGPVAAPVTWRELEGIDSAQRFTIADAARLVRRASSVKLRAWGISDQRLAA